MFITFEGIDASGKSTQLKLMESALRSRGFDVLATRQPGGTQIGKKIREVILNPENVDMAVETEVLLYMADRLQHLRQVVRPALAERRVVLCDRYHDALLVYQGAGREMDLAWLRPLEKKFLISPHVTFWLDISLEESQGRLEKRNQMLGIENCRLENETDDFFNRVICAYRSINRREPDRFIRIAADTSRSEIHSAILDVLIPKLEESE